MIGAVQTYTNELAAIINTSAISEISAKLGYSAE
jgi:hypothetical protein